MIIKFISDIMKKKLVIIALLIVLLANVSTVSSSWYDWSRYEQDGYSFKIPEDYYVGVAGGSNPYYLLVEDNIGNNREIIGNRMRVITTTDKEFIEKYNEDYIVDEYDRDKSGKINEILKYNNSTTFYKISNERRNTTVGIYKTDNGTYIIITHFHAFGVINNDEERIQKDINIINGMFESVRPE